MKLARLAALFCLPLASCLSAPRVVPGGGSGDGARDRGGSTSADGGLAPTPIIDAQAVLPPDAVAGTGLPLPSEFTMAEVGGYKLGAAIGKDPPR